MNDSSLIESDQSEYIAHILGPQVSLSLEWMILLTFVYVIIFVSGFAGNLLVVIVILKFRFMRENMTNLYLCNLAITDLLSVLAGMPLELYQLWHQYPWTLGHLACHLKSLVLETTSCASVLTLVTLTVERFRAICISSDSLRATQSSLSPSESIHMKRVACRNILIIWILSLMAAAPLTVFTQINYLYVNDKHLEESAWCGLPFNAPNPIWQNFMIMSTVAFFIIPLFVLTLLYSLIGRTLRKASRIPNPDFQLSDPSSSRKIMKSRTIVVRLLVAIVIVFTICWTPFHAQRLLWLYVSLYGQWTDHLRQVNQVLFLSAGVFYYLNSSINPVLYSVMSTRFRAAFSLYVSDMCSHGPAGVTATGSTRVSGARITRKPRTSDQSMSEGRQSGIFGPVPGIVGGGVIASGGGILSNNSSNNIAGGVTTPNSGNNHHNHHHGHPHATSLTTSPSAKILSNSSTRPEVQWTKNQNTYYHV